MLMQTCLSWKHDAKNQMLAGICVHAILKLAHCHELYMSKSLTMLFTDVAQPVADSGHRTHCSTELYCSSMHVLEVQSELANTRVCWVASRFQSQLILQRSPECEQVCCHLLTVSWRAHLQQSQQRLGKWRQVPGEEAVGMPISRQPPCPAHSMDIGVQIGGKVVVYDIRQILDVKAPSCYISGHQHLGFARLPVKQGFLHGHHDW